MPIELPQLLRVLRAGLGRLYGDRLRGLFLYGSYARNEQDGESDLDVLVVLDQFTNYGAEVDRTAELVASLSLEHGVSISIVFARQADWERMDTPFYSNVRREAVAA